MPLQEGRGFGPHRGYVRDDARRMVGTHRLGGGGMLRTSLGRESGTSVTIFQV